MDDVQRLKLDNRKLRRKLDDASAEQERLRGERQQRRLAVETHKAVLSRESELRQQITDLEGECRKLDAELAAHHITQAAADTGQRLGIAPTATVDYLRRVIAAGFTVRDGVVVAPEGVESLAAWTLALRESDPHLFAPSRGDGAQRTISRPSARWMTGCDPEEFGYWAEAIARGAIKVTPT